MKAIGGYFELELFRGGRSFHSTPYTLKSGRSSLRYILDVVRPSLVYIPYYTCDALIVPFESSGIPFRFYTINEALDPEQLPVLNEGEMFLYVNYFDIKRDMVQELSALYGENLIVDCSQAFFMKGNGRSWFFNSCRKFFGVPDGSYLYAPDSIKLLQAPIRNESYFFDHLLKRFNGDSNAGYNTFVRNEIACGQEWEGMSKLSEYLLSNVNYEEIIMKRRSNFLYLHKVFGRKNSLDLDLDTEFAPLCYPLLPETVLNKKMLYIENIYIPTFWLDVLKRSCTGFDFEKGLANKLVPLPLDQRYDLEDMDRLINILKYNHDLFCLPETS